LEQQQTAIILYDTKNRKRFQVTSGFYDDDKPVFDPDGKYLYYRTKRLFEPIYSEYEPSWIYANGQSLVAVPLRKDVPSPLALRNDEEPKPGEKKSDDKDKKSDDKADEDKKDEPKKDEPAPKGTIALEEKKPE